VVIAPVFGLLASFIKLLAAFAIGFLKINRPVSGTAFYAHLLDAISAGIMVAAS